VALSHSHLGFSQVTESAAVKPGNRLNGFGSLGSIATWLKPGVNKTGMLITGWQLRAMLHFKLESTFDISHLSFVASMDDWRRCSFAFDSKPHLEAGLNDK